MTIEQGRDGADAQPTHRGAPMIRTIAMPADASPAGDIVGGWLMAQMDLAAGNVAVQEMRHLALGGAGRARLAASCRCWKA
jgi:acyl-CoA thioesterase YciA